MIKHAVFNSGYGDDEGKEGHRYQSQAIKTALQFLDIWKEDKQIQIINISFRDLHCHHGPAGQRYQLTLDCFYEETE